MEESNIIFFDGYCNLCNSSVNFIIDRDKKAKFLFAAIQGDKSKAILEKYKVSENLYSILYLSNGKIYDRSSAALRICLKMDGLWPLCSILLIVPKFLRDLVYNFIARNRYKWFEKRDECRVPEPEIDQRFI